MAKTNAKEVVLEIIRNADGEWSGKSRLYKAFYFAHLYYANEYPGLLTDWPIAHLPHGPGPHNGDSLLLDLVNDGLVKVEMFHEGPYPEYRYRLTLKGRKAAIYPAEVRCAIKEAITFCEDKTASELSQITHERSRSWRQSKDGDLLDIYLDTIPDDEFQKRQAELERLDKVVSKVFKKARK